MIWYQGGIAEAVAASQLKKAVFLVAIFGPDVPSQELENSLNSQEVQSVVSTEEFVCIRLDADSQQHKLFADIYANAKSPSVYCITNKGVPVEIITEPLTSSELQERVQSALTRHREVLGLKQPTIVRPVPVVAGTSAVSSATPVSNVSQETENTDSVNPSNASEDLQDDTLEDRIQRARELAQARALQKQKEEQEEHKRREQERRDAGKGMAELKRWQQEQEAKRDIEERKKDKEEEKALRQRLREQIAQDRAARNARANVEFLEQPIASTTRPSVASTPPANFSGQARLQFRLPDGSSQTHAFDPDSTLGHVRQFLKDNGTVPFSDFSIWVAFPRRQFTSTEYGTSLRDLGLLPSAALLILPSSGLSTTPRLGGSGSSLWALIAALLGYVVYPISIIWSYFQRALPSPSTNSGSDTKPQAPSTGNQQGDALRSLGQGNKLGGGSNSNNRSNQPSTSAGLGSASTSANNDNQSEARKSKEKGKNSPPPEGNVHRLRTTESDSDDEKATWNGNSTQQM